jgi:dihydrolipoamide dehydrogenase
LEIYSVFFEKINHKDNYSIVMDLQTDILIIGAGPGGYPAAIRSAQLGKKVIIVEKEYIGGECLNWGCIPSKALIQSAKFYDKIVRKSEQMGIKVKETEIDITKMQTWKNEVQDKLIEGIKLLLKTNNVEVIFGTANFESKNVVQVTNNNNEKININFDDCIISTGTEFISVPNIEIDEIDFLTAKGALNLNSIPEHLVCIGGGIIGLELGMTWAKLGAKVTIIEMMPNILNSIDKRATNVLKKKLGKYEVEILTSTKVLEANKNGEIIEILIEKEGQQSRLSASKVLISIGKRANTKNLELNKIGVELDQMGFIKINTQMKTNIDNIYAVGDCVGEPFLAHKATKQGVIAAEVIAGEPSEGDWRSMPSAIFTDPEIATVGLNEKVAKELGYEIVTGMASFNASGRALTQLDHDGYVKIISDQNNGIILGVEIVGANASDLISEAALAIEMGATVEDIGYTIHPHPTLPEMIMEAAEAIEGKAIHVPNKRKKKN